MALKKFTEKSVFVPSKKDPNVEQIKSVITAYMAQRPRDLQVAIGPSSIGVECDRNLVAEMSGLSTGPGDPSWYSFMGTAAHAEMALVLEYQNYVLGRKKWLIEESLEIMGDGKAVPKGSCDAFDTDEEDVWDWKFLGKSSLDDLRMNGPGPRYRIQAHTYGFGWAKRGYNPRKVKVAGLPRNPSAALPFLHEMVVWEEDFDIDVAINALQRAEKLFLRARELKAVNNPKKLELVRATPGDSCKYCIIKGSCPDAKTGGYDG